MAVYAFGVGLANFGGGLLTLPLELAAEVRRTLPLIASYRGTGNFAFADDAPADLASRLESITATARIKATPWAVVSNEELKGAVKRLSSFTPKSAPRGVRPTPGLAFAVESARNGQVHDYPNVCQLKRLRDDIVAVIKFDVLAGQRLDSTHRKGGWGRISGEIEKQVGGRWTARSRSTIDGLIARVEGVVIRACDLSAMA